LGTSLRFILNKFSNKTYSYWQVNMPNLYKHVTARSYVLNRLDDTMTDLQNIHWATLRSTQCISWRHVIMTSYLYINTCRRV